MKVKILRQVLTMSKYAFYGIFIQGFLCSMLLASNSKAQLSVSIEEVYLSVNLHDAELKEVFNEIESQTAFMFAYSRELVNDQKRIESFVHRGSLASLLREISQQTGLRFKRVNENIHVSKKGLFAPQVEEVSMGFLQEIKVNGIVKDVKGAPLPGVTILLKGTSTGTTSDMEGHYSLNVPADATLQFSYIGFETQEVAVGNRNSIDITLLENISELEEVVVVGYGTQKKLVSTGSVNTIGGEELQKSPTTNLTNNLVGRMPGVVALNESGEPGFDGSQIRIRGSNTLGDNNPLIVIDGIANRQGGLARLDPNDIESMTVLKDASAAIYGSQAANGVILITTKRGKKGKPTVNFNFNQGFNQPTRLPEMADAATYATMLNEIDMYRSRTPRFSDEEIQKFRDGSDPWYYPNTNWYDEVIKPFSSQYKSNLSVSGGGEKVRYFVSLGTNREDGYYENSATKYTQYNFRSNIDADLTKHIKVSFDVSGRQENRDFPTRSAGSIFRGLMRGKPNLHAYWPNGMPGPDIENGNNPVVTSTDATGYDQDKNYYLQSNLRLDIQIPGVEGLSVTSNVSFDKNYRFRKRFETPWYLYTWDGSTLDNNNEPVLQKSKRGLSEPRLQQWSENGYNTTLNMIATYERNLGNHFFSVMVGTEAQEIRQDNFDAFRRYYISSAVDQLDAGGEKELNNGGEAWESARLNYFGRVSYNYREKYLLGFVWRYDGSYLFPKESRYGFFPGVSLGWRVSEEPFWKDNIQFIDDLKLRASWGQTGNDRIKENPRDAEFQYLAPYEFGDGYVFGVSDDIKSIYIPRVPNTNITWEVANQFDIGIEGQMMQGKIAFEFDYFYNQRSNILWFRNASVPGTAGIDLPQENIGKVVNRGVDGRISYAQQAGNWGFDISVNAGLSKNKITYWDEAPGKPEWQRFTGHPMMNDPNNPDLYYKAIGVFNSQDELDNYPHWEGAREGDIIFEDVNKDGEINGLDRVRIDKNKYPTFTGGLALGITFKQFDFNMLFQGATGGVQYIFTESGEIGNFLQEFADQRWTPDNPNSEHPRTFNRNDEYWVANANTYWLRKTDYLRLKNLEFGYNLPKSLNEKLKIQNARIYVSGYNLLTIDNFNVFDPETTSNSGQYYPQKRVFNMGVSLTF
ncbi:TonB-dependent receptor [Rapidithrix thailandica]|uniref:TonB-dependent receptor n=1 Tax=Rapidithrix thailandica TaxID=413964 RepID=A0AAW9S264_9BACT